MLLSCVGLLLAAPVQATTITKVTVEIEAGTTRVSVGFDGQALPAKKVFSLTEGEPRLVMDWSRAGHSLTAKNTKLEGQKSVNSVRYAERGQGTRIVLDLASSYPIIGQSVVGQNFIVVLKGGENAKLTKAKPSSRVQNLRPRYFKRNTPYPILKPDALVLPKMAKAIKRRPVIVIDAGHGGRDPGALGQRGTKEKKITFAAAKELRRQLLATGQYAVIMTRDDDSYVEHEERLRIARAGSADLFISLHADSAGKSARGATVYTLADRAKNRSRRVVNSQNWIMDVDLTQQSDPVGDILVDLAQRSTKNASTRFADILLANLKNSTRLINNSHRRAGYFVLLAPDVPAVLLELGYLSNLEDEKLLNKASHRKKVISSVTAAINSYFKSQKS